MILETKMKTFQGYHDKFVVVSNYKFVVVKKYKFVVLTFIKYILLEWSNNDFIKDFLKLTKYEVTKIRQICGLC